jgi:hypothetical protein
MQETSPLDLAKGAESGLVALSGGLASASDRVATVEASDGGVEDVDELDDVIWVPVGTGYTCAESGLGSLIEGLA